jgi:CubicO group peptidase (beta-lactamase class C family)
MALQSNFLISVGHMGIQKAFRNRPNRMRAIVKCPLQTVLLAIVCIVLSAISKSSFAQNGADQLTGLWGSEQLLGFQVQGKITIDGRSPNWVAHIYGFEVGVKHADNRISFSLPHESGDFRGSINPSSGDIDGHWIQARLNSETCCAYRYASPLHLKSIGSNSWEGSVVPLRDTVSLYLLIRHQVDDSISVFIQNPESGLGRRRPFVLSRDGEKVALRNTTNAKDIIYGRYDEARDRITLHIPEYDLDFVFTRRDRNDAVGFYPRTPDLGKYVYRVPERQSDGWKTASLGDVGMNQGKIVQLIQRIQDTQNTDWKAPYIQGLLIARHGRLVLEEYFYGFSSDRPHDMRSAGKSFTTTLLGIAMDHGAKVNPSTPLYSLFPEYKSFSNPDPRKQQITVRNLLAMTSGFACDDNNDKSPGAESNMMAQHAQPDWYKYALDLPVASAPDNNVGEAHSIYCTAGMNLIGGIIRNTTKEWVPDFFESYFARPLDIHRYYFDLGPTGDYYGGGGGYFRPRDWIKLGQVFDAQGMWNGRRIISARWVKAATTRYGWQDEKAHGYGYGWHIFELTVGSKTYHEFEAEGNGGQLVSVIPELDLVVCFSAGNYQTAVTWRKFRTELIPNYIIGSIQE